MSLEEVDDGKNVQGMIGSRFNGLKEGVGWYPSEDGASMGEILDELGRDGGSGAMMTLDKLDVTGRGDNGWDLAFARAT